MYLSTIFFSVKVVFSSIHSMKIDRSYERFILDIAVCLKDTEMSFVEGKVAPKYPREWIWNAFLIPFLILQDDAWHSLFLKSVYLRIWKML